MITEIVRNPFGLFIAVVLMVGFQDYYRIPNDRGGIGAQGKIGRGTSPGERLVPVTPPARPAPGWVYVVPGAAAPAGGAPAEVGAPAGGARVEAATPARVEAATPAATLRLPSLVRANPYSALHRGWIYGYWNARLPDSSWRPTPGPGGIDATPGKGPSPLLGVGLGWGLPAWLIGPIAYSWGYLPYANPFWRGGPTSGFERQRFDDYSWPINVLDPPPTEALLHEAMLGFEAARQAFREEKYPLALRRAEEALRLMPDDPMLHQFRALCLFALGRYDEAAATLHAVLAVAPGWDWTTLVSLYGDRRTYTRQLRLLEVGAEGNAGSAADRFLLAWHYLTTGYDDEAVDQLDRVLQQHPDDALTARLLRELRPSRSSGLSEPNPDTPASLASATGATPGATAGPGKPGQLVGTWIAHPKDKITITLDFRTRGRIAWKVAQPGRDREFTAYAVLGPRTLIFYEDENSALVGTIRWQDERHFTFKALAGRPADPGLSFAKAP